MHHFLATPAHDEPHIMGRSRQQHDKYLIAALDEAISCCQGPDATGNKSATTSQS
jgi:hypothetical protein